MFPSDELKVKLKEEAAELGFDALGVCGAHDFCEGDAARLRAWLANGMNDKMAHLARAAEKKISPSKFLDGAQSAVVVCANFFRPSSETRVALYAQGGDYHEVLRPKLERLAEILAENGGEQKISIDASPLWEKMLAARAGLGWIGKNTLLIRRENGAWNFIGAILTTLFLPRDKPVENLCKDCDACVRACPASALSRDGLDARICISNLSIERKGELSEAEKKLVGARIFGCDACLRACPFGFGAPAAKIKEFQKTLKLSERPTAAEISAAAEGTPMRRRFK